MGDRGRGEPDALTSAFVVADASALIALHQIGRMDVLRAVYPAILIPPAVAAEIRPSVAHPDWIVVRAITGQIDPRVLGGRLGRGEQEALTLALELHARRVVVDDFPARRRAAALGLPLIGTLGVLMAAKRQGVVPTIREDVESLLRLGFRLSRDIVERALADIGEGE